MKALITTTAVLLASSAIAGCAPAVDKYKIISVPTRQAVKIKTVTKSVPRKCPALPQLSENPSQAEINAHHKKVIIMYKECTK